MTDVTEILPDPHDDVRRRWADLHDVHLVAPMPDPRQVPPLPNNGRALARAAMIAVEAVVCFGFVGLFWWALS